MSVIAKKYDIFIYYFQCFNYDNIKEKNMASSITYQLNSPISTQQQERLQQPITNISAHLRSSSSKPQQGYLSQTASNIARNSTNIALGMLAIYAISNIPTVEANCIQCVASCMASGGTHYQCTGACLPVCIGDAISLISTMFGGR